jgi:N-acetylneuraminic acid mutarotase
MRSRYLLAVALGAVACADALRLEPPTGGEGGAAASGGQPPVGGGGGAMVIPCESSSECPAPTSVCDTVRGECVECLELGDCGHMPGTVCDLGHCRCAGGLDWCAPSTCVDTMTSPVHCGACDHACFGACAGGACVDAWEPLGTMGAPAARGRHASVWTGTHMFVWGGLGGGAALATGALYDPATQEWTATSLVDAPSARQRATAVWTGTEVIVWGGHNGSTYFNDGAAYDPATQTWRRLATSAAPPARILHTAVWTGSAMIVWGGEDATGEQLANGGVYDPAADAWSATAAVPLPAASRERHSAVWADGAMWLYGGLGDAPSVPLVNEFWPAPGVTGGIAYNPAGGGSWSDLAATGEPSARDRHTAVWTGTAMLVFGGFAHATDLDSGHRYVKASGQWEPFGGTPPSPRREHSAVWLEDAGVMVVWGGRSTAAGFLATGAVYDAQSNAWEGATPTVLEPRIEHTALSIGDRMIVWGGLDAAGTALANGALFTP